MKPKAQPTPPPKPVEGEDLTCCHIDACRRLSAQSGVRWPRCEGCGLKQIKDPNP